VPILLQSPKLPGANFSAVRKSNRRPPVDVASITLPGVTSEPTQSKLVKGQAESGEICSVEVEEK
jgi:hypothetical protein